MTTHEEPIETKIDFQLNIDEPDDDMRYLIIFNEMLAFLMNNRSD